MFDNEEAKQIKIDERYIPIWDFSFTFVFFNIDCNYHMAFDGLSCYIFEYKRK